MQRVFKSIIVTDSSNISILLCIITFSLWQFMNHSMPFVKAIAFFFMYCIVLLAAGRLANQLFFRSLRRSRGFAFELLTGYCIFNSLVFCAMVLFPFGLRVTTLSLGAMIMGAAWRYSVFQNQQNVTGNKLDCYAVIISLLGATLLSQDSLFPITAATDGMVFKPWLDSFYHTRVISIITNWSGRVPFDHLAIAGQPTMAYHFAGYTSSAILSAFTNVHSYFAFSGFHVPFGVFLTGLAAYVLMSVLWGKKAGLVAPIALLLLPDAAQQGIHNHWLSYHWLQQIAPNAMYGIVLCVMAWSFMHQACKKTNYRWLLISYIFLAFSLIYKAQIFVPNAILLWLWAPLFIRNIKVYQRILWFGGAFLILYGVMKFSQHDTRVPTLLFDGSAFAAYTQMVIGFFDHGWAQDLVVYLTSLHPAGYDFLWQAAISIVTIYAGTFGAWGLVAPLLSVRCRQRLSYHGWFPLAVMALYLIMAFLLAFDSKGIGTKEELLHRPLVWAYFICCSWSGSALFYCVTRKRTIRLSLQTTVLVTGCLVLSIVPFLLGRGLEKGPSFGSEFTNTFVAQGQFEACRYIREASAPSDVLLDSQFDRRLAVTALSERQSYFMDPIYGNTTLPHFQERLLAVQELAQIDSIEKLRMFRAREKVDWCLVHPEDRWPLTSVLTPVFSANGYRVYHLSAF